MTTRRPLRSFVVWTMIIFWRAILSQYDDDPARQQEELRRLLFTLREQILPPPLMRHRPMGLCPTPPTARQPIKKHRVSRDTKKTQKSSVSAIFV